MNDTIKPENGVAEFVDQVRARLADLTADERAELADGLEADLAEQVAERGSSVLVDPATYAVELRSAAGFSPVMGKVREKRLPTDPEPIAAAESATSPKPKRAG